MARNELNDENTQSGGTLAGLPEDVGREVFAAVEAAAGELAAAQVRGYVQAWSFADLSAAGGTRKPVASSPLGFSPRRTDGYDCGKPPAGSLRPGSSARPRDESPRNSSQALAERGEDGAGELWQALGSAVERRVVDALRRAVEAQAAAWLRACAHARASLREGPEAAPLPATLPEGDARAHAWYWHGAHGELLAAVPVGGPEAERASADAAALAAAAAVHAGAPDALARIGAVSARADVRDALPAAAIALWLDLARALLAGPLAAGRLAASFGAVSGRLREFVEHVEGAELGIPAFHRAVARYFAGRTLAALPPPWGDRDLALELLERAAAPPRRLRFLHPELAECGVVDAFSRSVARALWQAAEPGSPQRAAAAARLMEFQMPGAYTPSR